MTHLSRIALLLLGLLAPSTSSAQDNMWKPINGSGSVGERVTVAGLHTWDQDSVIMVGTEFGKIWATRSTTYSAPMLFDIGEATRITSLLDFRRAEGDTALVVATANGIFISLDDAYHFTKLSTDLQSPSINQLILLKNATSEQYLLAATPVGIARSSDLVSWQMIEGITKGVNIAKLSDYGNTIVAISNDGKMYRSSDGGATWAITMTGLADDVFVQSHAFHQPDASGSMILTNKGLFYSSDRGANWSVATQPGIIPEDSILYDLTGFDRSVTLTARYSIYRLAAFENSWYGSSQPFSYSGPVKTIVTLSNKLQSIFIADSSATYGITPLSPISYAVGAVNIRPTGRIYSLGSTVMISDPPYDRWITLPGKLVDETYDNNSVGVSQSGSIVISKSSWNRIMQSDDTGRTWRQTANWEDIPFPHGEIDATSDGSFWLNNGTIFMYAKGSTEWWPMLNGSFNKAPLTPTLSTYPELFSALVSHDVTRQDSILRSPDGGNSWTAIAVDMPAILRQRLLRNALGYIYAVTKNADGNSYGDIYRSVDKGVTWTKVTAPHTEFSSNAMKHLVVGPRNVMIVLSEAGRLYRSLDNGDTWSLLPNFPQRQFGNLHMDSLGFLYGTDSYGLFRSEVSVLGTSSVSPRNQEARAITVFPNPAMGWVTLNLGTESAENVTITLVDALGRVIDLGTLDASYELSLSLLGITPGCYMLNVFDGKTTFRSKLAIE